MSETELLDIYDDALTHIGVKARNQVHRDGDWHRTFQCWVILEHEGNPSIVLQKRGADKTAFPNLYDISAAGHYTTGEDVRDGLREIEEELGITVAFEALIPLGRRISIATYNGNIDREVSDVFFVNYADGIETFTYDPEEVSGLAVMSINQGLDLFSGKCDAVQCDAYQPELTQVTITKQDFIQHIDSYVYKVFALARRFIQGDEHLVI